MSALYDKQVLMPKKKTIALVAHNARKPTLVEYCKFNAGSLAKHYLIGTGTTSTLIREETNLPVIPFKSGPLGGDQELGALIANFKIDILIFFWDTMWSAPHSSDISALLRNATMYNAIIACNRATADFIISSPLFDTEYTRLVNSELDDSDINSVELLLKSTEFAQEDIPEFIKHTHK